MALQKRVSGVNHEWIFLADSAIALADTAGICCEPGSCSCRRKGAGWLWQELFWWETHTRTRKDMERECCRHNSRDACCVHSDTNWWALRTLKPRVCWDECDSWASFEYRSYCGWFGWEFLQEKNWIQTGTKPVSCRPTGFSSIQALWYLPGFLLL